MTRATPEEIKKIVRDVLAELGMPTTVKPGAGQVSTQCKGPKVLMVFHAGVRRLDEALKQARIIKQAAGKCSVFTGESARSWVRGDAVREKTGSCCILDRVKPDGLQKVQNLTDIVILPTFCIKVAAKVAHLTCDNQESSIVLSALLQGKKVLASRDSFLVCDVLTNEKLREEMEQILSKLEGFGMVFCPTEQLSDTFKKMVAVEENRDATTPRESGVEPTEGVSKLITAKAVNQAVDNKQASIRLARGGKITPLARDLAKEYSVKIIEN